MKKIVCLCALLPLLVACQQPGPSNPSPASLQVVSSPAPKDSMATPALAKEAPEGSAAVIESFGEKVLASKNGSYQVQLKPAGDGIDIFFIKSGGVGDPAFSSGGSSTSSGFQDTIKKQLETHPSLRSPTLQVLETAARPESPEGLALGPSHQAVAKSLLDALGRKP